MAPKKASTRAGKATSKQVVEPSKAPKRSIEVAVGIEADPEPEQPAAVAEEKPIEKSPIKKKAKLNDEEDPVVKLCTDLAQGMRGATADLDPVCHQLIHALSVGSLPTPKLERHPVQTAAIELLKRVLTDVEASRNAAVNSAEELVAAESRKKLSMDETCRVSDAKAKEKRKEADVASAANVKAKSAAQAAVTAFAAAQAARETRQTEIFGRADVKQACQSALDFELVLVKDGASIMKNGVFVRPDDPKHLVKLQSLAEKVDFDDTYRKALPASCSKCPAYRSELERKVLLELEKALVLHIKKLEVAMADADPAAVAAADDEATRVAELTNSAARSAADAAANRMQIAKETAAEAEDEASHARRMAQLAADGLGVADRKMEACRTALKEFVDGPVRTLKELSGASSEAVQDAPAEPPKSMAEATVGKETIAVAGA